MKSENAAGTLLSTRTAADNLKEVKERSEREVEEARAKARLELKEHEERAAELRALLGESTGKMAPRRAARSTTTRARKVAAPAAVRAKDKGAPLGRLPRRSPEDLAKGVEKVASLLRKKPEGLNAETIKAELGIDKRELPAIFKAGLASKVLKSKGQKRATRYFLRESKTLNGAATSAQA